MPVSTFITLWQRLRSDGLLLALLLVLPLLVWLSPERRGELHQLVHWHTLYALAGLMILSRGLEDSGLLGRAALALLRRLHSVRALATVLVLFAALLSAVVTNDVALFIVVPLTLGLRRIAVLPIGRLIVFEALAVNAGSTLSPVGNPQNLFLWQHAGVSFMTFMQAMVPLALALLVLLLLLVPLAFHQQRISTVLTVPPAPIKRPLMLLSLVLYPGFLFAVEWGQPGPALLLVFALYLLFFARVLRYVDWLLLLVFALMFIDLRLLAELPVLGDQLARLEGLPGGMMTGAMLLSQGISNVPAAILLADFTTDWRAVAWGVSVGGFGLLIGSLANLIALRLAGVAGLWRDFHRWSLVMILGAWLLALLLR